MRHDLIEIEKFVDEILPQVVEIRHHIHANPELSLKEYNTSKFIRKQLSEINVNILPPFLETDVIAILNESKVNKNITLRADIDALPIQEKSTLSYSSNNNGIMHACGHDGHTAILLGTAFVLNKFKDLLDGSVRFVFQPGEEVVAGGRDLVKKGILENPEPNAVLAFHGWPGYPIGSICSRPGTLMAAADVFKITLTAEGGHGSKSNLKNNPIFIASEIIKELSLIPTKHFSSEKVVVSVSKITGGSNPNVIPTKVILEGSVRYLEKVEGEKIPGLFEDIIHKTSIGTNVNCELEYQRPYIPTVNNSEVISTCKKIVKEYIGEKDWIDIEAPVMTSEDFSYYIDENPGAMFFLGMGDESELLHTDRYNFNDEAIKNGILFLVISTVEFLSKADIFNK